MITKVKTPRIEEFFISSKTIEVYTSKMGMHDPFGHLQHKLRQKERSGVKIGKLTPYHKKLGIDPTSVRVGGV